MDDDSKIIKVIVLGESGVGKKNLINSVKENNFEVNSTTTCTCSCNLGKMELNGKQYTYNVWDIAGQEKYRSLSKMYINDSNIVIFIYAINEKKVLMK